MSKTIIVSNRLPLDLSINDDELNIKHSIGGLATGLKSVHEEGESIWIGWSGLTEEEMNEKNTNQVEKELSKARCVGVSLNVNDVENFYYGFSNNALWPLFHYFQEYASFELEQWESYQEVNRKFANVVLQHAQEGDTIWIHDYQLMLLPEMLRQKGIQNLTIGFFLHIPFPSAEIFRTFPWREELLHGLLGANLVGFHTYDYVRHFLSAVKRIGGLEIKFNEIYLEDHIIKVDSFPMGIDFNRYNSAAIEHQSRPDNEKSELMLKLQEYNQTYSDARLVLSIDRMDYTKGIPNRIKAFEYFLEKFPEFREKVRLVMLSVPSRENVPQYQKLKRETDELVGSINGRFATVNWTPVWYFYRSMPFDDLIDLYASADVAMITPLRDGMNLVAKEYLASRSENNGVIILSEMAGAAKEMYEALIVNPYNFEQIAISLKTALEMHEAEQKERMIALRKRVSRYTVEKWADDFMKSLHSTKQVVTSSITKKMDADSLSEIKERFKSSQKKLLFLDYDGTLTGFKNQPEEAAPDKELLNLLDGLAAQPNTELVLISGRDRKTMGQWFEHKNYTLITDHGVWLKKKENDWEALEVVKDEWKSNIRPVMETYVDRTPGAFIEEKEYSLAWHYRKADTELSDLRKMELKLVLDSLIANNSLSVLEGNKVLEVKNSNVNKGRASSRLAATDDFDFILALGDDWTDEHMFEELQDKAITIKVGSQKTTARYSVKDVSAVRNLLKALL